MNSDELKQALADHAREESAKRSREALRVVWWLFCFAVVLLVARQFLPT